ncbi:MAG TPA: hypothetical protein PLD92_10645 [Candidatus Omnitrophota bacterium]|nr:hypothetical protein [Candidatus Omnitrophota bacterium]
MAKEIRPQKIIINIDGEGQFRNGVLIYVEVIDGKTTAGKKSIGIKGMDFSKINMTGIIDTIIDTTRSVEGIAERVRKQ